MPRPDNSAFVRNTQDWLVELRALRDKALARHDLVQAEELQAEIARCGRVSTVFWRRLRERSTPHWHLGELASGRSFGPQPRSLGGVSNL
jgi:hypothetical protein